MSKTINGFTATTSAASGDFLLLWRTSNGDTRKITKANFLGFTATGGGTIATGGNTLTVSGTSTINGTVSGGGTFASAGYTLTLSGNGGTLALGGFTLTVGATGTAMLLGGTQNVTGDKEFSGANTFSGAFAVVATPALATAQAIITSGDAARRALRVNIPTGASTEIQDWCLQNVQRAYLNIRDTVSNFALLAADFGTARGCTVSISRNNNASTPAAGNLFMEARDGTDYYLWVDASGVARIGTTQPTFANDGGGTVIGAQSSAAAAKDIDAQLPDYRQSLGHITEAVQGGALRSWKYKSGAYNGQHFPNGLVVDYAPRYSMDMGRSLNVPVAIGDLMAAVVHLSEEVETLRARLN